MHLSAPKTTIFVLIIWIPAAIASGIAIKPNLEQARLNAFPIFNSIHAALRQWGSSIDHNGLSFIPATVSKNQLLYHGTHSDDVNTPGLEWLSFEPEHSEPFAYSWRSRDKNTKSSVDLAQKVLGAGSADDEQPPIRGYLRTYQTTRDLNLLYLDGMSASKGCWGPMDGQDLVLRLLNGSPCDHRMGPALKHEIERVTELCKMTKPLGYDGLLRMEAGFEIVYCDFSDGALHLLSNSRRPFWDEVKAWYSDARFIFHMVRAATQHYGGIAEAGEVQLDFSRMVSAYFYPVNLSSTDTDASAPDLGRLSPRLMATTPHERQAIRHRIFEVAKGRSLHRGGVPWQAVTDAIVSRYADRLALLAHLTPSSSKRDAEQFVAEVLLATNTHVDYYSKPQDFARPPMDAYNETAARMRCYRHLLQKVEPSMATFTPEDHLIYAAVTRVTMAICDTLFQARSDIEHAHKSVLNGRRFLVQAVEKSQTEVRKLVRDLQWTRWLDCGGCAVDEVCFYPMAPFGSKVDHERPRCLNEGGVDLGLDLENNFWQLGVRDAIRSITEPYKYGPLRE